jgi:hypothetical protein
MPRVIWEDSGLTTDDKVLLSVVCSINMGEWTTVTWGDVTQSLGLKRAVAVNLIESLSAKGAVEVAKTTTGHIQLRLGIRFLGRVVLERLTLRSKLTLSFIQCLCGYDLRMDFVEQIRICPDCRRVVYYTQPGKEYLLRQSR